MQTLSSTVGSVDVLARDGFESSQSSRNVIHTIINATEPNVSLQPATPRSGRFTVLVANATDAETARAILTGSAPITYTDPVTSAWTVTFVLPDRGEVRVELDQVSRSRFLVTTDFMEVAA